MEQKISSSDPEAILRKGYSVTTHNSKVIHSTHSLQENDEIETKLHQGKIWSRIQRTK
jgi:exodeoxyribonuclease VII large subunit